MDSPATPMGLVGVMETEEIVTKSEMCIHSNDEYKVGVMLQIDK